MSPESLTSGKRSSPSLEEWLCDLDASIEERTRFVGLGALSKALVLSAYFSRVDYPILTVFASPADARNAIDNLTYFGGPALAQRIHYVPSIDFDFYRGVLPNPELLCERNVAFFQALNDPKRRIFVTTVRALLQKAVPPQEYLRATRILSPNDELNREEWIHSLLEAGYQAQPSAYDPGVFSVRGGVIDVFCPLYPNPLRIEFFGDLIEEMRFFEPQTQRSLEKLEKAFIIPVGQSLVPQGKDYAEAAEKVKDRLDHLGIPKSDRQEILEKIKSGVLTPELSFLFPLLSKGSASFVEFLPKDTRVFWDGKDSIIDAAASTELPLLMKSHELYEKEPSPIANSEELFLNIDELKSLQETNHPFYFESFSSNVGEERTLQASDVQLTQAREELKHKSTSHPLLEPFAKRFKEWMEQGYRIQVVSHTQTHAERLQLLLEPYGIRSRFFSEDRGAFPALLQTDFSTLNLWQGYITQSQVYPMLRLVVLSEEEIFGQKKRTSKSAAWSASNPSRMLSSFRDLKVNDFVVHKDHGIGKYLGLRSMNFLGVPNDYVLLEYKDNDKLYIPIYRLNVLQKYVGGEGAQPAVDKLGGDRWIKVKEKAQKAIAELAVEFLNTHAKRKLIPAHAFSEPSADFREFEMEFPFDETPDQMRAIEDVMGDMSLPHPMDRLVCGDVGYGKTEVAMRAAYRCVLDGKQVALLVPTTVLAFQHFENFKQRFSTTAARVEMVSRLRTSNETKKVLETVKAGKVDILIGTHRLLSADIHFQNLGLVIVDEEHRFGVVHKERLKKLSESVHVLSLTATPIPRTLNMAMTGIKEISIITTPPPDRLSVRTFVCRRSDEVILEAIGNELAREGQVFFVHNRIESINGIADDIRKLFPKTKIHVVHGQVDADELEKTMLAFYRGEFQVLVTTAIIESGLDIPRTNTILIDRADTFGLAQLYQLRGRVGRSERRAYCYLLVPGENLITGDAKQRLQVIQRYTDLGSGFNVASHDLEIRGAGDLLGKEQSGHLNAIGIDMYFDLLEESVALLHGQKKKEEIEPEINLRLEAFFPQDYLPDITERISLYRRLSSVETEDAISEIEAEIRDRFGTLPDQVTHLLGLMNLKLHLKKLHVLRMSCGPKKTSLQFAPSTPASPEKLVKLIQKNPGRYSLTPDQKLVFAVEDTDWRALMKEIQRLSVLLGVE